MPARRLHALALLLAVTPACGDEASSDGDATAGTSSGNSGAGGAAPGGAGAGGTAAGNGAGGAGAAAGSGGAGVGGGPSDPWAGCPDAESYAGDAAWPNTLEVTDGAAYCATFDESRTLVQELAAKALLRVAPGSYRLPPATEPALGLPICIRFGEEGAPVAPAPDRAVYAASDASGSRWHQYDFESRVPGPERLLRVGLRVARPPAEAPAFLLNGAESDPFDSATPSATFSLCQPLEDVCFIDRLFDSCTHASSALNRHDVELDTGAVSLELRIGQSFAGTEPGAFVRASGSFRGQSFDQRDYFKLVYHPAHHHFERSFAVLFDEPSGEACGVEISGLEPFGDATPDEAFTVDCALDRLEPLDVVSHVLTRDP